MILKLSLEPLKLVPFKVITLNVCTFWHDRIINTITRMRIDCRMCCGILVIMVLFRRKLCDCRLQQQMTATVPLSYEMPVIVVFGTLHFESCDGQCAIFVVHVIINWRDEIDGQEIAKPRKTKFEKVFLEKQIYKKSLHKSPPTSYILHLTMFALTVQSLLPRHMRCHFQA